MDGMQDPEGYFYLEYQLDDIGQPVNIVIPTVCDDIGSHYPMPDDAVVVTALEGVTFYTTAMDVPDVAGFYLDGMPDLGWEADDLLSQIDEESATLVFYDSADTQLMIAIISAGGGSEVTIVETEAE